MKNPDRSARGPGGFQQRMLKRKVKTRCKCKEFSIIIAAIRHKNIRKMEQQKEFKPEFYVYKFKVTREPVLIMSKKGEYFNKKAKIDKYKYLGYTVTDLKGNTI